MSNPENRSSRPHPVSGLKDHVGYWLRAVSNQVSHAFGQRLISSGVTTAEWVILREAFEAPATSVSALADLTGLSRGAVSKLVDRLEAKKLLVRKGDQPDKRRQAIGLSEAGRSLVPVLARHADENDRHFFSHLTTGERRQLVGMMRDMARRHHFREVPVE